MALPGGRITVTEALAALAVHYNLLLDGMRRRIHATSDPVTQDLLISVTAALEKQHWMLRAEGSSAAAAVRDTESTSPPTGTARRWRSS